MNSRTLAKGARSTATRPAPETAQPRDTKSTPSASDNKPPGSLPGAQPASTAVANEQIPPPKRTLTASETFVSRLSLIYLGHRTDPKDLFEPMIPLDPMEDVVGIITNQQARELFSLASKLEEEALHLPRPRRPEQKNDYMQKVTDLCEQKKIAMDLFWQHVRAAYPKECATGGMLDIRAGWRIIFGEDLREELEGLAERLGMPPGLVERLKADMEASRS